MELTTKIAKKLMHFFICLFILCCYVPAYFLYRFSIPKIYRPFNVHWLVYFIASRGNARTVKWYNYDVELDKK
jgi:hypothetical protein